MALIASLILAAGGSSRMGRKKLLLTGPQGTLLRHAVLPHLEAGMARVVVVLGADAQSVLGEAGLPRDERLRIVENPGWAEGLSSSIRSGVGACPEAEAVMIALGDEPDLLASVVASVRDAFRPGVHLVAARDPDGHLAHPVLFARELFPELLALRGDVGARAVVQRYLSGAVRVAVPAVRDIDTPDDYRRWQELHPLAPGREKLS